MTRDRLTLDDRSQDGAHEQLSLATECSTYCQLAFITDDSPPQTASLSRPPVAALTLLNKTLSITSVSGHGNVCFPATARWKIDPTKAGASEIFFIIPFLLVSLIREVWLT
jgi:hypothetical protein